VASCNVLIHRQVEIRIIL